MSATAALIAAATAADDAATASFAAASSAARAAPPVRAVHHAGSSDSCPITASRLARCPPCPLEGEGQYPRRLARVNRQPVREVGHFERAAHRFELELQFATGKVVPYWLPSTASNTLPLLSGLGTQLMSKCRA